MVLTHIIILGGFTMKNDIITIAKVSGIGNCKYVATAEEVPSFLLEDHSVRIVDSGLEMYCVDGTEPAVRPFPVFLKWEEASEEKRATLIHKVNGITAHPKYGTWPKDNGFDTLDHDEDGNCFPKGVQYLRAALVADRLPSLNFESQPVSKVGNQWMVKTSWGEDRYGDIGKAVFVEYGAGNINIVALSEASAKEYTVFIDGVANGNLVEYFA